MKQSKYNSTYFIESNNREAKAINKVVGNKEYVNQPTEIYKSIIYSPLLGVRYTVKFFLWPAIKDSDDMPTLEEAMVANGLSLWGMYKKDYNGIVKKVWHGSSENLNISYPQYGNAPGLIFQAYAAGYQDGVRDRSKIFMRLDKLVETTVVLMHAIKNKIKYGNNLQRLK